ncbi:FAD-dependent oxidoreductase [Streptomyces verrucosisporus]|uniref:NAD(P)/FAD-dependent oxidoreductase n=1 Tax=Streptomyces verrucosisporus TaxID=1695161 RepID=UPI0019D1022F|nr:FAD-dependent oxidoreductase [Streptomyces verrucosisporus]MBN3931854.1 FAD-dependent oxidoreductase [Streptomyces verrucosisporus]
MAGAREGTARSTAGRTAGEHGAPDVVVVGAGQGGVETVAALRARGFPGRITLVAEETALPYQRPPLSKGYLLGTVDRAGLELRPDDFFSALDIDLVRGDRAAGIDRDRGAVELDSGRELPYGRLVLATGSRPRRLPVAGADLEGVRTLRSLAGADELRGRLTDGRELDVVVVGAGFLGLELAATARTLGHRVTVVEASARVMSRVVTEAVSEHVAAEHRGQGVRVLTRREVVALHGGTGPEDPGHVRVVELDGGERLAADLVVVGIGALPNVELATAAGLLVGDGVIVDPRLRTSDPDVYAVGDCARFPSPWTGRHVRLESVQNASDQARRVAADILGETGPYTALPWFWSEQYGLRLQMAGLTAGHDEAVVAGDPDAGRFSVFCFRAGRLTGVESVNRPADHGISRRLLASGTDLTPRDVARPGFDLRAHAQQRSAPPAQQAPAAQHAERPVHA